MTVLYVRWREHDNANYTYGRWRGQFSADGSYVVYEIDRYHDKSRDRCKSRATRSLRFESMCVRTQGPRKGAHWVPFVPQRHLLMSEQVAA